MEILDTGESSTEPILFMVKFLTKLFLYHPSILNVHSKNGL